MVPPVTGLRLVRCANHGGSTGSNKSATGALLITSWSHHRAKVSPHRVLAAGVLFSADYPHGSIHLHEL